MYPRLSQIPQTYRFDGFEVDVQTGSLTRDRERIQVQELPFQLLVALLERPGELVGREELQERLWPPGVHLDFEISLATAVKKLRQALGDTAKEPRFIETLPGRGYRFLRGVVPSEHLSTPHPPWQEEAPATTQDGQGRVVPLRVAHVPEPAVGSTGPRRHLVLWSMAGLAFMTMTGALVLVKPWHERPVSPLQRPRPSVVALPTKVNGPIESSFLTDAIPDTFSTLLAGDRGIEIKSPPSSGDLEKLKGDTDKVAAAYGVDHLLLTSITVQEDRLLMNAQLVEVLSRKVRWAAQFEGTKGSYNELVRAAVVAVVRNLQPWDAHSPEVTSPAFSSAVELALREGKYFRNRWDDTRQENDFEAALGAFQRAQSLEPSSAILAAELATMYRRKFTPEARQLALTWVSRALKLDPRCGLAWALRSVLEFYRPQQDPDLVISCALKGLALAPSDGRVHIVAGNISPTHGIQIATALHAMDLSPLDVEGYDYAALGLTNTGRAAEALPILERALRLFPDQGSIQFEKFRALDHLGRNEKAMQVSVSVGPRWQEAEWAKLLLNGKTAKAREKALRAVARWREVDRNRKLINWSHLTMLDVPLLARMGLREEAFWILLKTLESGTAPALDFLLLDPDLKPLQGDPRFAKVLAGSRDYALRYLKQAEPFEARGELPAYLVPSLVELRELLKKARPEAGSKGT